ncbi:MAG TPA: hypothetical protein VN222_14325, partial [Novosphingobium sp.]|nr:hypothetical protein [Novosphingobium sp.]
MAGTRRIAYLVHDLQDAAVARRVAMLRHAGHRLRLAGFHRRGTAPARVSDVAATTLGRTQDGRLVARLLSVLRHFCMPGRVRAITADADVLVARNLETLVLAARVRRDGQRLVYECLDIHRLLLSAGMAGRLVRAIEGWAMRRLDLLVVSAPAFRDAYFAGQRGYCGPSLLLENKVPAYAPGQAAGQVAVPEPPSRGFLGTRAAPWVIGWFGMLRCRRTLEMLGQIAARSHGRIEVLIAGKPSPAEFADFAGTVGAMPGVRYVGPYTPADLPGLFGQIHFIWAIDYFEEGLNSQWLLPNRLYEGIAHGAVPIALDKVATGQWLRQRGAGLRVAQPVAELDALLAEL